MSKRLYHITREGNISECTATKIKCPYGGVTGKSDHYATPDEARYHYEKLHETFPSIDKTIIKENTIKSLPSKLLEGVPLKDQSPEQLVQSIRHSAIGVGFNLEKLDEAIDLATLLHSNQTRRSNFKSKGTPYIEHPLRNSLRLLRMRIRDEDIIIACLLHDTIEDSAQEFVKNFLKDNEQYAEETAREKLSQYIKNNFGERVQVLVESVTNDYITETTKSKISLEERNQTYYKHVSDSIKDYGSFLVKYSDFVDNALSLKYQESNAITIKQARKYYPVISAFKRELINHKDGFDKKQLLTISVKLNEAAFRLKPFQLV